MPTRAQRYAAAAARARASRAAELTAAAQAGAAVAPMQVGLASPFHEPNNLQAIVWADLTGQTAAILSRATVMAIPAVARQRHLIAGAIARCPLVVMEGAVAVPTPPSHWTTRTDGQLHPYHRMLWTVDDLMFTGWSLWRATRGSEAQLLSAERVPTERWDTDEAGRVRIDGELADAAEVILIPGPHEGILNFGGPALRRMIDNLDAAATAARNPSAYLNLHWIGDDDPTDTEVDKAITRWAAARRGENGGVSFTGRNIELQELGTHESHLLIEGRNADAVDASRLVSSPAAMADATAAGASLTYETVNGRNQQFVDHGVALYMDAIAARLSMDDVVPRGQRTTHDTSQLTMATPSPTGAPTND